MKYITYIVVLTAFLISCSKDNQLVNSKTESSTSTLRQAQSLSSLNLTEYCCKDYMTRLTPDSWCCEAATANCLPCVTIFGEAQKTNFETAIEDGALGIVEFFEYSGNWDELFPYLADSEYSEFLNKLLSGDYSIVIYEDDMGQIYYLATHYDGDDEFALPLNSQEE